MIPSPSHPSKRKIRFGIKISKSIERMKRRTRAVKRVRKGSFDIYERENSKTFPEMKSKVEENSRAIGSKIKGKLI